MCTSPTTHTHTHAHRVIDVGSEWRTFSNDSGSADRSRVGAAEDPVMDGGGLTTFIGPSATPFGMKDTSSFSKWQKTGVSLVAIGELTIAWRLIAMMQNDSELFT